MNKIVKIISTLAASLISFNTFAADAPVAKASPVDDIVKQTVATFMAKNKISGVAVELYIDGVPHTYNFGYANTEKKIPVSQKTIFEVGSLSKVMTGILLAQEIDYNRMSLTDPVKKYIKDCPTISTISNCRT